MEAVLRLRTVAQGCIEDPDYARSVLEGDDHPEVRQALVADLELADGVKGFLTRPPTDAFGIQSWDGLRSLWSDLEFGNTRSIIIVGR